LEALRSRRRRLPTRKPITITVLPCAALSRRVGP
jgi:hypothetical protein